jgi:NAD(P)H dehydrogenase (quinone)
MWDATQQKETIMTIGITGATGQLGRLAVAALKAKGADVVALVRDTGKAADLGVPARAFDYKAADAGALAGIDTLVLISSNDFDDRAGQHKKVIAAAKAAGVGRVVYTSLLKGDASPMILAADHVATEAALKASGLTYTILRNGWYLENHTGNLGGAIGAGAMIGSSGEGRISAASRADYAEAIAAVADGQGHENKVYELAGDDSFTVADMAAVVSQVTGKEIPFNNLPEDTYAGILQSFGLPEGFAKILADSDVQASKGALFDDSKTLSRLIGRPTTPMVDAVKAALA